LWRQDFLASAEVLGKHPATLKADVRFALTCIFAAAAGIQSIMHYPPFPPSKRIHAAVIYNQGPRSIAVVI
jgi:hypothetical protein